MNLIDLGPPLLAAIVLAVAVLQLRKKMTKSLEVQHQHDLSVSGEAVEESEESDKMKAICFFGSQTGTAEGFAKQVVNDLNKAGFAASAVDLEDVSPESFCSSTDEKMYHLYFMATYGEGDPTDNAIDFMSYLTKDEDDGGPSSGVANRVYFTVFGLGNTQYEHYNKMAKVVQKRLSELGGSEIYPLGLGDDDNDIEEDFNNWREGVVACFSNHAFGHGVAKDDHSGENDSETYTFTSRFVPSPENISACSAEGVLLNESIDSALSHHNTSVDLSSRHFYQGVKVNVVQNKELRQINWSNGGYGSTRHIEFDLSRTGLTYSTADNLTVLPENDRDVVTFVASLLNLNLNQWFIVEPVDPVHSKKLFPSPCTVRTALAFFTDLNGPPTRSLLSKLSAFVTLREHRERLRFLASKEGKDDFHHYVTEKFMSVSEVFETFPSFDINETNLGAFFEVMPRLKGREFTISSSSNVQPNQVALTVGVVREEKPGEPKGRILNGVCSTYLNGLQEKDCAALVFVKESTFKMPEDPSVPIIMIGPGTGIAPMRAFIQERHFQKFTQKKNIGETVLFFGCRKENEDFLYREELFDALKNGTLSSLHTAFSRQQEKKVYVQHVMEEEKALIWNLIQGGAFIYVCGATSMGRDVNQSLINICASCGGMTANEAKEVLHSLQEKKRYVQELWSS